jgi:hypothetical protein
MNERATGSFHEHRGSAFPKRRSQSFAVWTHPFAVDDPVEGMSARRAMRRGYIIDLVSALLAHVSEGSAICNQAATMHTARRENQINDRLKTLLQPSHKPAGRSHIFVEDTMNRTHVTEEVMPPFAPSETERE